MKKLFLIILSLYIIAIGYQPIRYKDKVFTEVEKTSDIQYGSNVDYQNKEIDLLFDFYEPKGDTIKNRPCIVFIHGGAFMGGDKLEANLVFWCEEFALRGYVTVSIQYRLGTGWDYKEFSEAILRAVQDAKASVRFLRKNKETYGIDNTKFVVGGTSAGGVTAIHYAYMDSHEIPSVVDTTILGGIEGESGTPGVSSEINCIVNCWGAIGDTAWLEDDETIPIVSFHGTEDDIVPYDTGFAFNMPFLPLCGSAAIDRHCQRLGITSEFQSYVGMGHGHEVEDPQMDTTLTLMCDFIYDNLFGNIPITYTFYPNHKPQNRSQYRIVYSKNRNAFNHISILYNQGELYSVNGRNVGTININNLKRASGIYIIYNRNEHKK